MDVNKIRPYCELFSIMPINDNKTPIGKWKHLQNEKMTFETFQRGYKNLFGIITGFEDLEVIDVDLKVFSTAQEKTDFWNEYLKFLKDNIYDFDDKFAIYKTVNAGYHILFKSKRVEGCQKIAKLKGHQEQVIETRGTGGFVVAYPENKVSKLSYFDITYISDEDREILFSCSRVYNYVEEVEEKITQKVKKEYTTEKGGLTPWDDFIAKNKVIDLIRDEFIIPTNGQKSKHTIVKRNGATSPHSGYIYKDNDVLYLFTTATKYPAKQPLNAFQIYTIQKHHGDYKASTIDLYNKGYGDRIKKKVDEIQTTFQKISKEKIETIDFPIDIFPEKIQSFLIECNETLGDIVDYTGSAMIWLISLCVGNSIKLEVKNGWTEGANVWISLVGKAGIGKTPSLNRIIQPLKRVNQLEFKRYLKENKEWKEFDSLSTKEKGGVDNVPKPKNAQFISTDTTVEALIQLHQESDNCVGIYKDELSGWIKDMNKYREGSDLEFWLSAWAGESIVLNRVTRDSNYIDKPCLPVLGGIQPSIFERFYTDENKDNGFMDRMLLAFPDFEVSYWNEKEIAKENLTWYNESIVSFYDYIKRSIIRDSEGNILSHLLHWSKDAKKEWIKLFNEITEKQLCDTENEYLKSMYPKQIGYVARFCLLLHVFNRHFDNSIPMFEIQKQTVLDAKKLSDYFVNSAKKVRFDSIESKSVNGSLKGDTPAEKIANAYKLDPEVNRTKLAESLGVSRSTVARTIKELQSDVF